VKDEAIIREKIALLKEIGFSNNKLRAKIQFYVHVDSDEEYDSGVYRCREVKKLSCNTYLMYNIDNNVTQWITDLKRWSKGKAAFWSMDIADYIGRVGAKAMKSPHVSG